MQDEIKAKVEDFKANHPETVNRIFLLLTQEPIAVRHDTNRSDASFDVDPKGKICVLSAEFTLS
jgi:hypothetical protein